MEEEDVELAAGLPLNEIGQKLRSAREAKQLTVEQLAAETRIPIRHLEAIEQNRFGDLPAPTYATGFSRSYAKAVGLDPDEIATLVRGAIGKERPRSSPRSDRFEPGDPERVPPRSLAILALIAAVLLIAGGIVFYKSFYGAGATPDLPDLVAGDDRPGQNGTTAGDAGHATANGAAAQAGEPAGANAKEVVFTARGDPVWVRFTDEDGRVLIEKTLQSGESYRLPGEVRDPRINTGRPDALQITVGAKPVPPLADAPIPIANGKVSAEALLSRTETSANDNE